MMADRNRPITQREGPRVLLCIRHYYPDGGGAEIAAHRLAVELRRRGVPIRVLTGRYGGGPRSTRLDAVPLIRHFIGAYVPVLHELCYLASLSWQLSARRGEYDIVHVFQTQLSTVVAVAMAKFLGKRVVVSSRGAGPTGDIAMWGRIPAGKQLLRFVQRGVDAAVGVSRDVTRELLSAGFDPTIVRDIPNGVAVGCHREDRAELRRRLRLPTDAFITLFVGRLSAEKAVDFLIRNWSRVLRRYPSSELVIVGDGPLRGELMGQAIDEGLGNSVRFEGWRDNVNDYVACADVFLLPSQAEGMSMALLEAMAAGLAVIASKVAGTVDVVENGENGLLFEPGDKNELLACIFSLIEIPERRMELGRRARKRVEDSFSLDATVDLYLGLYTSLMKNG
jgi:glycosyltransferase involved in cell wall biosynthesis